MVADAWRWPFPIGAARRASASIAFLTTSTAIVQVRADPAMRGRVLALQAIVFLGSTPIGGPILGVICEAFGARAGLVVGGLAGLAAAGLGTDGRAAVPLVRWGRAAGVRRRGPRARGPALRGHPIPARGARRQYPLAVTEHQEIVASQPPDHWDRPPTDWSFVWRPGWILSHLFVASCVVAFVLLGFWQLSRLQERKDANALIRSRETAEPVPLGTLIPVDATTEQSSPISYRKVTVTGHYDTDNQVLIRNRTRGSSDPGLVAHDPADHVRRQRRGRSTGAGCPTPSTRTAR